MYRKGYVKPDGNGMTGGHWWSRDIRASKEIEGSEVLEKMDDLMMIPDFRVDGKFKEGEDESVGLAYGIDIESMVIPRSVYEEIDKRTDISAKWKAAIKAVIDAYIDGLEPEDFNIEED